MPIPELAIIGAGPIGIELAVALKRRNIPYLHFDAKQIGQTMFWWPPGTRWFSSNDRIAIAGVPLQTLDGGKATREDYLRYLRTVCLQFQLDIHTFEPVTDLQRVRDREHDRDGDHFRLTTLPTRGEQTYRARRVVLATGGTASPRLLNVPGEDLPHVSHYMEDPHKYFGKKVLVVGGKNSAVEAALRIHQAGADVSVSYRRSGFDQKSIKYWLYPEITGLIKAGKIHAHFNTLVTRIDPDAVELAYCTDDHFHAKGPPTRVDADFVLLLTGYVADMSLARLAGVELRGEAQAPLYDESTMETNVPGVYVAGTAIAGTQSGYRVFLENCHVHVDRILASITGQRPPETPAPLAAPET